MARPSTPTTPCSRYELSANRAGAFSPSSNAALPLQANRALRQLPFNGKKLKPAKLRKDYWRPMSKNLCSEVAIYRIFKEHNVQYVGVAFAGGDVGGPEAQLTVTQDYLEGPNIPVRRSHCRLVLKLGRPLHTYEHSLVLIAAVSFALEGK